MIYAIAAIDQKYGLATDHGIPWNIPADKRYFRDTTEGATLLHGYRAYLEYPQPPPNRRNVVVVRPGTEPLRPGFEAVEEDKLAAFLEPYKTSTGILWIAGGAKVYELLLPYTQRLYLTRIDGDFNCTKFFPAFEDRYVLQSQTDSQTDNGIGFHFEVWQQKPSA